MIPCYRSEHTLPAVVGEITAKMQTLPQYDYEVILVNDCSPDDTLGTIRRLVAADAHVQGVDLARNFGQHAALMAASTSAAATSSSAWTTTARPRPMKWTVCCKSWTKGATLCMPATTTSSRPAGATWQLGQQQNDRDHAGQAAAARRQQLLCRPPLCGGGDAALRALLPPMSSAWCCARPKTSATCRCTTRAGGRPFRLYPGQAAGGCG